MSENDLWVLTGAGDENDNRPSIRLRLERYGAPFAGLNLKDRRAVLLLHGASANSGTFKINKRVGLAHWLLHVGLDPWLLDWRGSSLVVDDKQNRRTLEDKAGSETFTLSHAAKEDLPAAIRRMRSKYHVQGPISLLGHCMGGAVIAEAVALDRLQGLDVDRVVLLALGLFYEAPIDGRLKSEERVLERLITARGGTPVTDIDPRVAPAAPARDSIDPTATAPGLVRVRWPAQIDTLYTSWPHALRNHRAPSDDTVEALCNRVAFMYGMPYHEPNLIDAIHKGNYTPPDANVAQLTPAQLEETRRKLLEEQFGGIPLRLYLHCAHNLRGGQAINKTPGPEFDKPVDLEKAKGRFHNLERVTLITGALNRLWHRDSIDRMYEWLTRGSSENRRRVRKHVLEDYAHQDLLWGDGAPQQVYPKIFDGLRDTT